MKPVFKYFFLGLIFLSLRGFSQNETRKWYFGAFAALDFMTNPPTILAGSSMSVVEGCASVADAAGNLLFYTSGDTIWNRNNLVMANGTGLFGSNTPTQSSLIIKQPGSSTLYYVFTMQGGGGIGGAFCYSIVDMSLAAGMGSVTVKNTLLYTGCVEELTGTIHCNGTDFWVLVHEWNSANFRAYLLTSAGVNPVPVISSIGFFFGILPNGVPVSPTFSGFMKISPNGKKLANVMMDVGFEVFDFDNSTGMLANSYSIAIDSYGCEFSPDGTKLYTGFRSVNNVLGLGQYDLCAGSPAAVAASLYTAATTGTVMTGSLQLAPDGKLYTSSYNVQSLGVVNNPNVAGAGCNFLPAGQPLVPYGARFGLPNFTSNYFNYHVSPPPFTYTINSNISCQTASFSPPGSANTVTVGCANFSLTNMLWDFGDPVSGYSNASGISNPVHYYASVGTYTVQLILYYTCGGGTDTLRQVVNVTQPCLSVSSTSITCANLGSATVTTAGGIGPYSYTWMPTGQTSSVATGLSPGTYTITVFDPLNNSTYSATTLFTSVIPLTGTVSSSSSLACNGVSTGIASIINLAGGSGNQGYLWTNGVSSSTVASPNNLSAGSWSSTVTDVLTGCSISNTFTISQPPALTLNIAAGTPTACAGSSLVLTGTNTGGAAGYTYTWTAGPLTNTYAVTQNTGGTYSYTLSSSDANGCLSNTTISVDFINNPTISISDVSVCPQAPGTLNAGGASSYTWSDNSTGSSFTGNPLSSTQYTVIGSALGCTAMATASIIIKPAPSPTLSTNGPLCNGDQLLLNASGGASYNWAGPPAFSSPVQNPAINPVSVTNAGAYNLTVTAANSCTAFASVNLTVNPTPTLAILGSTVCTSQTLSLDASSFAGATYTWSGPLSFTSNAQNISVSSPSVNQSGTYTVQVTSVAGCSNTGITTASVVPPPNLSVSLSSGSLCAQALSGSPNTITLTSSGADTYTLSTPNHLYNPNPSGPASPLSMQPPYQVTGPSTATLLGSNGVCTVSTTAEFTIVPNPTVTVSSPTPVICAGQSYTYTSSGAGSYTWSATSPGNTVYTTGSAVVASPTVSAVFSVSGSSLGCNSALQSSSITVNPLPQVQVDPLALVCKGSAVQLSANGTAGSYTWLPNLFLNSNIGNTVSASPPALQNYIITGSLNNCTTSAVITVSVLALPTAVITSSIQNICVNGDLALQGGGGDLYNWSGPSGFTSGGQSLQLKILSTAYAGIYTLTVTDQNNCKGSTTQSITVYGLPQGYFGSGSLKGCAPFCSSLDFKPNPGSASITNLSWQVENQNFSGSSFKYCFNQPGHYKITGILNDANNCVSTLTAIANIYPKPGADFSFDPAEPVENLDEVKFTSTSNGPQLEGWSWYFINNNGYRPANETVSYLFAQAGTYPVALVVSNTWGCRDSVVKTIKIESDFAIYIPDAFTPNSDGLNELFGPVMRGVKSFAFSIFDRWGTKIFETGDLDKGWDGTFRGQVCQQGVYVWKLNAASQTKTKSLSGQVLLYR